MMDAAVSEHRGKRRRTNGASQRLLQALKRQDRGRQALEREIVKTVGVAVGPGGALTALLAGMLPPVMGASSENTAQRGLTAVAIGPSDGTTPLSARQSNRPRGKRSAAESAHPTADSVGFQRPAVDDGRQ